MPHRLSTNNTTTIHLLSDGTGSTLDSIWPAIKKRFPENGFPVCRYHRGNNEARLTEEQLEEFIRNIINTPGTNIVYYTVENEARVALIKAALEPLGIECIDPLEQGVAALARASGQTPRPHGVIGDEEEDRIEKQMEAMRFWQRFDDGQNLAEAFAKGKVLLVAPSRVGKTGACAVLAMYGLKVANLPFVVGVNDDPTLLLDLMRQHPNVHVLGMMRDASELSANRRSRIRQELDLGDMRPDEMSPQQRAHWDRQEEAYFGLRTVGAELAAFRRFCNQAGIGQIIDTTRCQPEEVAARVLQAVGYRRSLGVKELTNG